MGLLDNFMPGETYGMPTQPKSKFTGLLDDPMFQFGLGVLANSQGTSLGQALGQGGQMAAQNLNQRRLIDQQRQLHDFQIQDAQRKQTQYDELKKAKDAFKLAHPEYADAVDLDPTLAIKAAYPQIAKNGADPYYTTIATDKGLGKFNARDGSFELITNPDGTPYVKSSDDPTVRGNVSSAEAQGKALWKPNTDIDGVVSTDAQIAGMANPALGNIDFLKGSRSALPISASPANFPKVTPQEQASRDNKRMQILLGERDSQLKTTGKVDPYLQSEINSMGIRVPTKAQEAGSVQSAKNASDLVYTPQIESAKKTAGMNAEAAAQASLDLPQTIAQAQESTKLVDELLNHRGFKSAVGMSSYNPLNKLAGTNANDFNIRLDQLKGRQFMQAFQSLKGGGQITEVEGKKATDAIARMNTSASEEEFKKAAQDFKAVINAGTKRAMERAGIYTNNSASTQGAALSLPAKPSALTLKKGQVYETPKGKLRWNGKSFEDL